MVQEAVQTEVGGGVRTVPVLGLICIVGGRGGAVWGPGANWVGVGGIQD